MIVIHIEFETGRASMSGPKKADSVVKDASPSESKANTVQPITQKHEQASDVIDEGFRDEFETEAFTQFAQKCMRCYKYLLAGEKTTADPRWKDCISHDECIPETEKTRYAVWKERKKP